jgi:hypothetical protein
MPNAEPSAGFRCLRETGISKRPPKPQGSIW